MLGRFWVPVFAPLSLLLDLILGPSPVSFWPADALVRTILVVVAKKVCGKFGVCPPTKSVRD